MRVAVRNAASASTLRPTRRSMFPRLNGADASVRSLLTPGASAWGGKNSASTRRNSWTGLELLDPSGSGRYSSKWPRLGFGRDEAGGSHRQPHSKMLRPAMPRCRPSQIGHRTKPTPIRGPTREPLKQHGASARGAEAPSTTNIASIVRVARLQVAKRNLCPPPSCFQGMSAIHFRRTHRDRFDPAHRRRLARPRRLVNQPSETEH